MWNLQTHEVVLFQREVVRDSDTETEGQETVGVCRTPSLRPEHMKTAVQFTAPPAG